MRVARPLHTAVAATLCLAALGALAQGTPPPQRRGPPRPPAQLTLPPAPSEQLEAASLTHLGPYECEFNEKVNVEVDPKFQGYIDVRHKNRTWIMKPVLSRTGALRLEDVRGRMLMLQIADKSMLMDTQIGQRVVDNCVHEQQRAATAARKAAGTQTESIGIDPAKAAAAAASAASAASAP
ncbi:MAG: hypothetical protein U1F56_22235 [Rubrivivax sp.]